MLPRLAHPCCILTPACNGLTPVGHGVCVWLPAVPAALARQALSGTGDQPDRKMRFTLLSGFKVQTVPCHPLPPHAVCRFRLMLPCSVSPFTCSPLGGSLGSLPQLVVASPISPPPIPSLHTLAPAVHLVSFTVPVVPRGRQMDEARTDSSSFSRPPRPSFCLKPGYRGSDAAEGAGQSLNKKESEDQSFPSAHENRALRLLCLGQSLVKERCWPGESCWR